jgi:hypothetical protein
VRDVGTWIDHLVFAAPTLEAGRSAIAALTGVTPAFGGVHTGAGTHNALASLGAPTYLEVIARDPDQPDAPPSPLVPGDLAGPRLVAFAVGCDDLDTVVDAVRAAGAAEPGAPYAMSRRRPDGSVLSWRLATVGPIGGATPFLISWEGNRSPAHDAPPAGRFVALHAVDPAPARARLLLDALGVDVAVEEGPSPSLHATIATATGEITLC